MDGTSRLILLEGTQVMIKCLMDNGAAPCTGCMCGEIVQGASLNQTKQGAGFGHVCGTSLWTGWRYLMETLARQWH